MPFYRENGIQKIKNTFKESFYKRMTERENHLVCEKWFQINVRFTYDHMFRID